MKELATLFSGVPFLFGLTVLSSLACILEPNPFLLIGASVIGNQLGHAIVKEIRSK